MNITNRVDIYKLIKCVYLKYNLMECRVIITTGVTIKRQLNETNLFIMKRCVMKHYFRTTAQTDKRC